MVKYPHFDDWWLELESYGLRCERFLDQLQHIDDPIERGAFIRNWLQAAFDSARLE
jgi:hypothetical protein